MPPNEKNRLVATIARMLKLVREDDLTAALAAADARADRSVSQILLDRRLISERQRQLLETLAAEHAEGISGIDEPNESASGPQSIVSRLSDSFGGLTPTMPAGGDWHGPPLRELNIEIQGAEANRYDVLGSHARGGLGEIYLALDKQLHREVALKEIQPRHADDPNSRARFVQEAEITGGLEHPGIVPVYGLGTRADGRPYYAMRFIRGRSLHEAIHDFHSDGDVVDDDETAKPQRPRPIAAHGDFRSVEFHRLLRSFVGVCHAMEYAHSRGVLHRDLKPANIMVGDFGETLVVDWGLAKSAGKAFSESSALPLMLSSSGSTASPATHFGSTVGTPAYMSPEQAGGQTDKLTPAADIFCLGATLYAMMTNRTPYSGADMSKILGQAQAAKSPSPRTLNPAVPKPLDAICAKAMKANPNERYSTCRAFAEDLERYLADEPVLAFREPAIARARRWLRKHPGPASATAATLFVGLLSLLAGTFLLSAKNVELRDARDVALANAKEAREQRDEADKQRNLARLSEHVARKAVDDSFTEISESKELRSIPGIQPFRKRMLEKAKQYYENFLVQNAADASLMSESAAAYFRLGNVSAELSPGPKVVENYSKSLELRKQLADKNPDDIQTLRDLATTWANLATQQQAIGKHLESAASFDRAIALQQQLANRDPKNAVLATELAYSLSNVSNLFALTGQNDRSEASLQRARGIYQSVLKSEPHNVDFLHGLATVEYNLGEALQKVGKMPEALAAYRDSLARREKLALENPQSVKYQRDLGYTLNGLGAFYLSSGKRVESMTNLEKSLAIRQRIAESNPSMVELQQELADSFGNVAIAKWESGKPDQAIESHKKAQAVRDRIMRENLSVPVYAQNAARSRVNLGFCLLNTAKLPEAIDSYQAGVAILEKLVAANPKVDGYLSDLAEVVTGTGAVYMQMAKLDLAEQWFVKSLNSRKKLVERQPGIPLYRLQLGGAQLNLGHIARDRGRFDASLDWITQSLKTFGDVEKQIPNDASLRRFLFSAHWGRAMTLDRMARSAESVLEYDLAEKLWPIPAMTDGWKFDRALALARLGDFQRLLVECDALEKTPGRAGSQRYLLAKACGVAGAAVELNSRIPAVDRKAACDKLASRAAAIFAKLAAAGELDAADWKAIADDRDLAWLRARPEFKNIAK